MKRLALLLLLALPAILPAQIFTNATKLRSLPLCAPLTHTDGYSLTWSDASGCIGFTNVAAGTGGANTALSNLTAVSINTALLFQTGVDLGSTAKPARNVFFFGSGTYATTYIELTGAPTSTRVWTFPDSTDTVVGKATTDTLTNKTLTTPTIVAAGWANANHTHAGSTTGGQLAEGALLLTDITTNNASTSNHGFVKKLSGSAADCFVGDGTFITCPGGTTYTAGNGIGLSAGAFSINTAVAADLPSAQAFAGVKTFSVGPVITESAASVTLNKVTISSTTHYLCTGNGATADCYMPNPMTTAGDLIIGGASGVGARYALTTTGGFLYNNGTTRVDRIPLFSDVSGTTDLTQVPLFATNAKTATYQVLAADFLLCKVIPVASGTFTVTLVASGAQPASGQCIDILNYGSGVVTVARSGQNINGSTSSQTLAAGSASAPTGLRVVSNGTDYFAQPYISATSSGATTALDNLASVSINTALLFQTGVDVGSTAKPARDIYLFGSGTYATTYLKLTGTPTSTRTVTFPDASITVARSDAAQTFTGTQTFGALVATTVNGNTFTTGTGILTIAASKTLTMSNTLTFTGTDSSSVAFGAGGTVVYTSSYGTGVATFLAAPTGANFNAMLTSARIEQNSKSAAYTTVLTDCNGSIYHPSADTTARTWTIDSNANVAAPIGCTITFANDTSGGVITIAITTDTLVLAGAGTTGSRTLAASGIATATKMTSTRWMINGTGLT